MTCHDFIYVFFFSGSCFLYFIPHVGHSDLFQMWIWALTPLLASLIAPHCLEQRAPRTGAVHRLGGCHPLSPPVADPRHALPPARTESRWLRRACTSAFVQAASHSLPSPVHLSVSLASCPRPSARKPALSFVNNICTMFWIYFHSGIFKNY